MAKLSLRGVKRKVCSVLDLQLIWLTSFGVEISFFEGWLINFVRGFNCVCLAWLSENLSSCMLSLNCSPWSFCEDKGTKVV